MTWSEAINGEVCKGCNTAVERRIASDRDGHRLYRICNCSPFMIDEGPTAYDTWGKRLPEGSRTVEPSTD